MTSEDSFGDATPGRRRRRPSSTPACTSSVKSNKDLRELPARAVQEPRVPGLRDGLVRRPRWRVRTEDRGARSPIPGFGPRVRRRAAVRRARRRRRDSAPDDPRHHARPPSRHGDRRRTQRVDGVALARGQRVSPTGSAAPSASIPTTSPAHCARSPSTRTTRAWCRSAFRCSRGRCTASRSTGRCGKRPSRRTCRSRCTSRSVPGSRSRRRRRVSPDL